MSHDEKELQFTRQLANAAAESLEESNYDETDTRLVKAVDSVMSEQLDSDSVLDNFRRSCLLTSMVQSKKVVASFEKAFKGADAKEMARLKAITADLEKFFDAAGITLAKEVKDPLERAKQFIGTWWLFNEAMKHGAILGWRSHEVAVLTGGEPEEAPTKGIDLSKQESSKTCNVLGGDSGSCDCGPAYDRHDCHKPLGHGGKHVCSDCDHEYDNSEITDVVPDELVT